MNESKLPSDGTPEQGDGGAGALKKDLPPYSERSNCPKCRCQGITTQYVGGLSNHLRRQCRRCGYAWNERPADG